jgi:Nif-specific regulatory protein
MDLSLQSKVLKVLEDKEFRRLGALRPTQVDVRIVAATNRDLKERVKEGLFREDLYYRLSVVPISVPPLREHLGSIEPMANYFLQLFAKHMGRKVTGFEPEAMRMLSDYRWPGNVRELRNVIERGLILSDGEVINAGSLGLNLITTPVADSVSRGDEDVEMLSLAEVEKRHIQRVLEKVDGNRKAAAEILQIHRTTLYKKIEVYELE